jgi:hypothetical protein
LGEDQIIEGEIPPLQGFLVQKAQGRHAHLDRAWGEFFVVEQVELKTAYFLSS